jgi:hypothetical protein
MKMKTGTARETETSRKFTANTNQPLLSLNSLFRNHKNDNFVKLTASANKQCVVTSNFFPKITSASGRSQACRFHPYLRFASIVHTVSASVGKMASNIKTSSAPKDLTSLARVYSRAVTKVIDSVMRTTWVMTIPGPRVTGLT